MNVVICCKSGSEKKQAFSQQTGAWQESGERPPPGEVGFPCRPQVQRNSLEPQECGKLGGVTQDLGPGAAARLN